MKIISIQTGFLNGNLFPAFREGIHETGSASNYASALWHAIHDAFPPDPFPGMIRVEVRHRQGKGEVPADLGTVIITDIPVDSPRHTQEVIDAKEAVCQRVEEIARQVKRQISLWITCDRTKLEIIKPNPECKLCGGCGEVYAGSVPYGSTSVSLPDDLCECVIEQCEYDDAGVMLDLSGYNPPNDHPPCEPEEEALTEGVYRDGPVEYRWRVRSVLTEKSS